MSDAEWSDDWNALGENPPLQDYDFLMELWRNYRKRWRVGRQVCTNFPIQHHEWGYGTIGTVTTDGTTITITDASTPAAVLIDSQPVKRWVSWNGAATTPAYTFNSLGVHVNAPGSYQIVVDVDNSDSSQVLRAQITDTTTTAFKVVDDGSWTLNRTLASLNGTKYGIITNDSHGQEGLSWADRWPPKPVWTSDYGTVTFATTTTLRDETKSWSVDEHAGKDLMVMVGTKQRRIRVLSNTVDTLIFASQLTAPSGFAPSGIWYLTKPDTYWTLESVAGWKPFKWYTGAMQTVWSHHADDELHAFTTIGVNSLPIVRGEDALFCSATPPTDTFDTDAYINIDDKCGSDDKIVAPDLWKCVRAIQAGIEEVAPFFILDYDVIDENHRTAMTPGVLPALMRQIDGNYQELTIASVSGGNATFSGSITLPDGETSHHAHWMRLDSRGLFINNGSGTITATTLEGAFDANPVSLGGDVGRTLGITLGWERTEPQRVRRIYPRIHFEPEMEYDLVTGDPIALADPPTENFPGTYVEETPSTNAAQYSLLGILADSGRAFVTDRLYRYVGHNRGDPTTGDEVGVGTPDPDPLTDYQDATCVCQSADGNQWLAPDDSGTVTSATAISITDENALLWVHEDPRVLHQWTATGGSATTLIDTTKSANGWWQGGIFLPGSSTRFVGMVARIEVSPGVWEKRLITGMNSATQTLTITSGTPVTNGMAYEIAEPAGVNGSTGKGIQSYWKGHTLRVTDSAGEDHDYTITHHDNDTIFFSASSYTPVIGDTWAIIYLKCGQTLRWNGTKFVEPDLSAYPEGATSYALNPAFVTNYGRWRKGDAPRRNACIMLQQMKDAIDALHLGLQDSAYDNDGEDNELEGEAGGPATDPTDWAALKADVAADWGTLFVPNQAVSNPPEIRSWLHVVEPAGPTPTATALNRYNYLTSSPFQCERFGLTERRLKIWVFATFDSLDSEIGTISNTAGATTWYYHRALYTNALQAAGGTGAALQHRKWTQIYDDDTSAADVAIRIGDDTLALPSWPASDPTYTTILTISNGDVRQTEKAAYAYAKFAVIDWDPAFEADV